MSFDLSDIEAAIKDVINMRETHVKWAEYFEAYPETEKRYVATGEWDSAKDHREYVKKYGRILDILQNYKSKEG